MKHTLSVLVENKPGVLTRVAALFARRGFNIDSLVVAETEDPELSRMTITVDEQDQTIDLARQGERIGSVQERRRPDEHDVSALPELGNDPPHPLTSKNVAGTVDRRATCEHVERLVRRASGRADGGMSLRS